MEGDYIHDFSGGDPKQWLESAILFFQKNQIPRGERMEYIVGCLDGEAAFWYRWKFAKLCGFPSWWEFRASLEARFGRNQHATQEETDALHDWINFEIVPGECSNEVEEIAESRVSREISEEENNGVEVRAPARNFQEEFSLFIVEDEACDQVVHVEDEIEVFQEEEDDTQMLTRAEINWASACTWAGITGLKNWVFIVDWAQVNFNSVICTGLQLSPENLGNNQIKRGLGFKHIHSSILKQNWRRYVGGARVNEITPKNKSSNAERVPEKPPWSIPSRREKNVIAALKYLGHESGAVTICSDDSLYSIDDSAVWIFEEHVFRLIFVLLLCQAQSGIRWVCNQVRPNLIKTDYYILEEPGNYILIYAAGVPGRFLHAVIGPDVLDVGSVASTIKYALYLDKTLKSKHFCTVPVINTKRANLYSHADVQWLLDSCHIDLSSLIFIDEFELSYYGLFGSLKLVLVTCDKIPFEQDALREAIVEVFHCTKSDTYSWVDFITVCQDISCCILHHDTRNLSIPNCTSEDKYMATWLINGAGRIDFNGLHQILKYKSHGLSDLKVKDILQKEFKKGSRSGRPNTISSRLLGPNVGMSSIGMSVAQLLSHDSVSIQEIMHFQNLEKLDLLMVISGYYEYQTKFKRESMVNGAFDKGAEIVACEGVENIGEGVVDQYYPPTVIVNVNHTMKLMQEEAFGPIKPIMKFSTYEETVKLANDSWYGLGCAVFSSRQRRAKQIASQIHCGVAAINNFASHPMCHSLPFDGALVERTPRKNEVDAELEWLRGKHVKNKDFVLIVNKWIMRTPCGRFNKLKELMIAWRSLIKWKRLPERENSCGTYPDFHLEDKVKLKGGVLIRPIIVQVYQRKKRTHHTG